jgi:hypothetical protein
MVTSREALYSDFIKEASGLFVASVTHNLEDLGDMVSLYALVQRKAQMFSPAHKHQILVRPLRTPVCSGERIYRQYRASSVDTVVSAKDKATVSACLFKAQATPEDCHERKCGGNNDFYRCLLTVVSISVTVKT